MRTIVITFLLLLGSTASAAETWAEKQARLKKEVEARYTKEREAQKKRLADLSKPKPPRRSGGVGFFYTDQFGVRRYYDPK